MVFGGGRVIRRRQLRASDQLACWCICCSRARRTHYHLGPPPCLLARSYKWTLMLQDEYKKGELSIRMKQGVCLRADAPCMCVSVFCFTRRRPPVRPPRQVHRLPVVWALHVLQHLGIHWARLGAGKRDACRTRRDAAVYRHCTRAHPAASPPPCAAAGPVRAAGDWAAAGHLCQGLRLEARELQAQPGAVPARCERGRV